jgi:hypothetical protein
MGSHACRTPDITGDSIGETLIVESRAMVDRSAHYEEAFAAFLRSRSIPFVCVEEVKKALFADTKLKSFDFVVYSKKGPNLLIDVKGRSHRTRKGGKPSQRKSFDAWATERDLVDLVQWEEVFGSDFKAVLTFVYWVDNPTGGNSPGLFRHRDRWYMVMGIDLSEYRNRMRRRSAKWETVCLGAEDFRSLARPLESWL